MAELLRAQASHADAAAAALVEAALREAIDTQGHAGLAIAGGSAARIAALVRSSLGNAWAQTRLTWVDERCVPFESNDSNRGEAYRAGYLDPKCPPQRELPLWLDDDEPQRAIQRVQTRLRVDFPSGLDVTLLGMGPDGHIASLFPGHKLLEAKPEEEVLSLDDSPKPPARRVTLSLGYLRRCPRHILFAMGVDKRDAVGRLLADDPTLPASQLRGLCIVSDTHSPETVEELIS